MVQESTVLATTKEISTHKPTTVKRKLHLGYVTLNRNSLFCLPLGAALRCFEAAGKQIKPQCFIIPMIQTVEVNKWSYGKRSIEQNGPKAQR